jgi:signal transduction histidine kinase
MGDELAPRPSSPPKLTSGRVENDLVLKRLDSGEWRLEQLETDVLALLQQCLAAQARVAAARQVLLTGMLPRRSVTLSVDALGFCRIVGNLVSNAIELSPPGGRVEVSLRQTGQGVALSVRDEGPGLRPEQVPDAFGHPQPDERARRGLQIVKRLAAAHGAQICVISAPGRGATFTVVFPALHATRRPQAAAHPRLDEAATDGDHAALEGGG